MKSHVLVGSYHKCGSSWMRSVFKAIALSTDGRFVDISSWQHGFHSPEGRAIAVGNALSGVEKTGQRCIFFEGHSDFPKVDSWGVPFSGFRLIRDPRDVIISAAKYHLWSEEAWLHKPQPKFGGKTYAEQLKSLRSFPDQCVLEMEESSGREIRSMLSFDSQGFMLTMKFEDLMADRDLLVFHRLLLSLGFSGEELPPGLEAFHRNSLFGGKEANRHVQSNGNSLHESVFDERIRGNFFRLFPNALRELGYERRDE